MGLLNRTWRVIRANLNSWVGDTEDPEKILEQIVNDMQQELISMRQAVAHAIATQKRIERQAAQNQALGEEWYNRAQLALQKGEEAMAKEALTRRKSYLEIAQRLLHSIEQERGMIERLKADMRHLEQKLSEAKTKKDLYIARARSAEASSKIQGMLSGYVSGSSLDAFERMENRVLELEAHSQVTQDLATDDLEKRFAALEREDSASLPKAGENALNSGQ